MVLIFIMSKLYNIKENTFKHSHFLVSIKFYFKIKYRLLLFSYAKLKMF